MWRKIAGIHPFQRILANEQSRKAWFEVLQTSGANAYVISASAVTVIVTARYLGPEGRGVLAAAYGWVLLFSTLGSLSLGPVVIHIVAGRPRDLWLAEAAGTLLSIVVAVTLFVWIVVWVAYLGATETLFNHLTPGILIVALSALPFLISNENGRYVLYALDAVRVYNLAQAIGSSLSIISILVTVIVLGWGIQGALCAFVLSNVANTIVIYSYIIRQANGIRPSRLLAAKLMKGGLQLHANAMGTVFFGQATLLILNHFRQPAEIGFYQLATQLFNLFMVGPTSIGTVAYQLVARLGPDKAWVEQRKLLGQALLIVGVVGMCGYIFAGPAVTIIAGSRFLPTVPLFRIVVWGLIGATLSAVMASQWVGRGLFWQTSLLTMAVGLVTLGCSYILIPAYGMYGATVSFLFPYGVSIFGNGLMALWVESQWRRNPGKSE